MKKIGKVVLIVVAFVFAVFPLLSQTPAEKKPSFEVVSIKPNQPSQFGIRGGGGRGDRVNLLGANLRTLVSQAYSKTQAGGPLGGQLQIIGGPAWIDSDRWDIDAKADCSQGTLSREQTQLMIQSMLEERFQLKAHLETREQPVYNLVVGKDGPKMKRSEDQTASPVPAGGRLLCSPAPAAPPEGQRAALPPPLPPPPAPGQPFTMPPLARGQMLMMMSPTGATMQGGGMPISNLIGMLQGQAGRPVFNKTGLTGLFDFKLNFLPENGPGGVGTPFGPGGPGGAPVAPPGGAAPNTTAADPVPSLFTAVQEQLGLKLEPARGPVEVVVIDSVQKPTEN